MDAAGMRVRSNDMRAKVTTKRLLIPKHLLEGVHEVDIRKENSVIVVVPLPPDDPILELGKHPVAGGMEDGSEHHDWYIYQP